MLARLWHDPVVGGDAQQKGVDARGPGHHRADEPLVAGDIHDRQLTPGGKPKWRIAELDRQPTLLLLREAVRIAARESADERGLAVVDVPGRAERESRDR